MRIIYKENVYIYGDTKSGLSPVGKQIQSDKELGWLDSFDEARTVTQQHHWEVAGTSEPLGIAFCFISGTKISQKLLNCDRYVSRMFAVNVESACVYFPLGFLN